MPGVDPIVASKQRDREAREAARLRALWLEQWPMLLVPSPADVALGYAFISADDSQMVAEPRKVTSRVVYDLARKAGWWVAASQSVVLTLSNRQDGSKGTPEPHEQIGVHAFWPSRYPSAGTVGLVGWWDNATFSWAARADYRTADNRLVYDRTKIGANELKRVIREMGGS